MYRPGFRVRKPTFFYSMNEAEAEQALEAKYWLWKHVGESAPLQNPPSSDQEFEPYSWYLTVGNIYFKREQDALLFMMKWK